MKKNKSIFRRLWSMLQVCYFLKVTLQRGPAKSAVKIFLSVLTLLLHFTVEALLPLALTVFALAAAMVYLPGGYAANEVILERTSHGEFMLLFSFVFAGISELLNIAARRYFPTFQCGVNKVSNSILYRMLVTIAMFTISATTADLATSLFGYTGHGVFEGALIVIVVITLVIDNAHEKDCAEAARIVHKFGYYPLLPRDWEPEMSAVTEDGQITAFTLLQLAFKESKDDMATAVTLGHNLWAFTIYHMPEDVKSRATFFIRTNWYQYEDAVTKDGLCAVKITPMVGENRKSTLVWHGGVLRPGDELEKEAK